MIKDLDSVYTCSRRSWEWVKLKKDYIDGLGDTLDLVLLAVYNSDMEVFETICKIGTGFSDEVLQKAYEFFQDKITPTMPKQYKLSESSEKMDVWFNPCAVWEVKGADFQVHIILFSYRLSIHAESEMLTKIEVLDCDSQD